MKIYSFNRVPVGVSIIHGMVDTEAENYFVNFFFKHKKNCVYFDVGTRDESHIVDKMWRSDNSFHLFEPHPDFFKSANIKYSFYKNVKINNIALGSKEETREYYVDSQGFIDLPDSKKSGNENLNLKIRTLDSYCEENNVDNIDFLKIDTEGFEREVMLGGSKTIENNTKCIQFEYGSTWRNQEAPILLSDVLEEYFKKDWYFYIIQKGFLVQFTAEKNTIEYISKWNYINLIASREDLKAGPLVFCQED